MGLSLDTKKFALLVSIKHYYESIGIVGRVREKQLG